MSGTPVDLSDATIDGEPLDGAVITLQPANPDALAVPGGDPANVLHSTLKYLGKAADWDDNEQAKAFNLAEQWATSQNGPFTATVSGVGTLGDNNAGVYFLDVPGLNDARTNLSDIIDTGTTPDTTDKYDGFHPHLTYGYGYGIDAAPERPTDPVTFDRVRVQFGPNGMEYPIGAARTAAVLRRPDTHLGDRDRHDYHDPTTGKFAPLGFVSPAFLKKLLSKDPGDRWEAEMAIRAKFDSANARQWVDAYRAAPDGSPQRTLIARKARVEVIGDRPGGTTVEDRKAQAAWDNASRVVARGLAREHGPAGRNPGDSILPPTTELPPPPPSGEVVPGELIALDQFTTPAAVDAEVVRLSTENPDLYFVVHRDFGPNVVGRKSLAPDDASTSIRDGYWKGGKFKPWTDKQVEKAKSFYEDDGGDGGAVLEKARKSRKKLAAVPLAERKFGALTRFGGDVWMKRRGDEWNRVGSDETLTSAELTARRDEWRATQVADVLPPPPGLALSEQDRRLLNSANGLALDNGAAFTTNLDTVLASDIPDDDKATELDYAIRAIDRAIAVPVSRRGDGIGGFRKADHAAARNLRDRLAVERAALGGDVLPPPPLPGQGDLFDDLFADLPEVPDPTPVEVPAKPELGVLSEMMLTRIAGGELLRKADSVFDEPEIDTLLQAKVIEPAPRPDKRKAQQYQLTDLGQSILPDVRKSLADRERRRREKWEAERRPKSDGPAPTVPVPRTPEPPSVVTKETVGATPFQVEAIRRWVEGSHAEGRYENNERWGAKSRVVSVDGDTVTVAVTAHDRRAPSDDGAEFKIAVNVTDRTMSPVGNVAGGTADERQVASLVKKSTLGDDHVLRKIVLDPADPRFPGVRDGWAPDGEVVPDPTPETPDIPEGPDPDLDEIPGRPGISWVGTDGIVDPADGGNALKLLNEAASRRRAVYDDLSATNPDIAVLDEWTRKNPPPTRDDVAAAIAAGQARRDPVPDPTPDVDEVVTETTPDTRTTVTPPKADDVTRVGRSVRAAAVSDIRARTAKLNERIAKKGLGEPIVLHVSEPYTVRDETTGNPTLMVDVDLDVAAPPQLPGGWKLASVADWSATDTPLVHNVGVDDNNLGLTADDMDRHRCDHCGSRRKRNRVFALRGEDGEVVHVGSTCIADFLGHDALAKLLSFPDVLDEIEDDDFYGGGGGGGGVPTEVFVAAAHAAVRAFGWHKSDSDAPTRSATNTILFPGRGDRDDEEFSRVIDFANSEDAVAYAKEAIAWARDMDAQSDFDRNLKAVANSEDIGPKAFGIAAYLPVAYGRHLDAEYERKQRADEEAARPKIPVPEGKQTVEGTVIGLTWKDNPYGDATLKMTVADDRGFRVWVTAPAAINDDLQRGDRVKFSATLSRSDDDETFGFGKRPTKAENVTGDDRRASIDKAVAEAEAKREAKRAEEAAQPPAVTLASDGYEVPSSLIARNVDGWAALFGDTIIPWARDNGEWVEGRDESVDHVFNRLLDGRLAEESTNVSATDRTAAILSRWIGRNRKPLRDAARNGEFGDVPEATDTLPAPPPSDTDAPTLFDADLSDDWSPPVDEPEFDGNTELVDPPLETADIRYVEPADVDPTDGLTLATNYGLDATTADEWRAYELVTRTGGVDTQEVADIVFDGDKRRAYRALNAMRGRMIDGTDATGGTENRSRYTTRHIATYQWQPLDRSERDTDTLFAAFLDGKGLPAEPRQPALDAPFSPGVDAPKPDPALVPAKGTRWVRVAQGYDSPFGQHTPNVVDKDGNLYQQAWEVTSKRGKYVYMRPVGSQSKSTAVALDPADSSSGARWSPAVPTFSEAFRAAPDDVSTQYPIDPDGVPVSTTAAKPLPGQGDLFGDVGLFDGPDTGGTPPDVPDTPEPETPTAPEPETPPDVPAVDRPLTDLSDDELTAARDDIIDRINRSASKVGTVDDHRQLAEVIDEQANRTDDPERAAKLRRIADTWWAKAGGRPDTADTPPAPDLTDLPLAEKAVDRPVLWHADRHNGGAPFNPSDWTREGSRWAHEGAFFTDHKPGPGEGLEGSLPVKANDGETFRLFTTNDMEYGAFTIMQGQGTDETWNTLLDRVAATLPEGTVERVDGTNQRPDSPGFGQPYHYYPMAVDKNRELQRALRDTLEAEGFDGWHLGGEIVVWNYDKIEGVDTRLDGPNPDAVTLDHKSLKKWRDAPHDTAPEWLTYGGQPVQTTADPTGNTTIVIYHLADGTVLGRGANPSGNGWQFSIPQTDDTGKLAWVKVDSSGTPFDRPEWVPAPPVAPDGPERTVKTGVGWKGTDQTWPGRPIGQLAVGDAIVDPQGQMKVVAAIRRTWDGRVEVDVLNADGRVAKRPLTFRGKELAAIRRDGLWLKDWTPTAADEADAAEAAKAAAAQARDRQLVNLALDAGLPEQLVDAWRAYHLVHAEGSYGGVTTRDAADSLFDGDVAKAYKALRSIGGDGVIGEDINGEWVSGKMDYTGQKATLTWQPGRGLDDQQGLPDETYLMQFGEDMGITLNVADPLLDGNFDDLNDRDLATRRRALINRLNASDGDWDPATITALVDVLDTEAARAETAGDADLAATRREVADEWRNRLTGTDTPPDIDPDRYIPPAGTVGAVMFDADPAAAAIDDLGAPWLSRVMSDPATTIRFTAGNGIRSWSFTSPGGTSFRIEAYEQENEPARVTWFDREGERFSGSENIDLSDRALAALPTTGTTPAEAERVGRVDDHLKLAANTTSLAVDGWLLAPDWDSVTGPSRVEPDLDGGGARYRTGDVTVTPHDLPADLRYLVEGPAPDVTSVYYTLTPTGDFRARVAVHNAATGEVLASDDLPLIGHDVQASLAALVGGGTVHDTAITDQWRATMNLDALDARNSPIPEETRAALRKAIQSVSASPRTGSWSAARRPDGGIVATYHDGDNVGHIYLTEAPMGALHVEAFLNGISTLDDDRLSNYGVFSTLTPPTTDDLPPAITAHLETLRTTLADPALPADDKIAAVATGRADLQNAMLDIAPAVDWGKNPALVRAVTEFGHIVRATVDEQAQEFNPYDAEDDGADIPAVDAAVLSKRDKAVTDAVAAIDDIIALAPNTDEVRAALGGRTLAEFITEHNGTVTSMDRGWGLTKGTSFSGGITYSIDLPDGTTERLLIDLRGYDSFKDSATVGIRTRPISGGTTSTVPSVTAKVVTVDDPTTGKAVNGPELRAVTRFLATTRTATRAHKAVAKAHAIASKLGKSDEVNASGRTQRHNARAVRAVLTQLGVPMGGTGRVKAGSGAKIMGRGSRFHPGEAVMRLSEARSVAHGKGRDAELVTHGLNAFPTSWVEALGEHTFLVNRRSGLTTGGYNLDLSQATIDIPDASLLSIPSAVDTGDNVIAHEVGHTMEHAVPGLWELVVGHLDRLHNPTDRAKQLPGYKSAGGFEDDIKRTYARRVYTKGFHGSPSGMWADNRSRLESTEYLTTAIEALAENGGAEYGAFYGGDPVQDAFILGLLTMFDPTATAASTGGAVAPAAPA